MDAIFSSDLATSRNNKGYQQSFSDFVKSLMSAASKVPPSGPVDVDLMETAVNQLWNEVCEIINLGNDIMRPFLKKFGAVDENGLSLLATNIDKPEKLMSVLFYMF